MATVRCMDLAVVKSDPEKQTLIKRLDGEAMSAITSV